MITEKDRKTSKEIEKKILLKLKKGPSSTEKLRKDLDSNWSTINNYLEKLQESGKVREIVLRNNLKFYIRSDYPSFYGLPLEKEVLSECLFLLKTIIEVWKDKNKGEIINKTTMQKIAVEVIKKNKQINLPILKFHYGKTLPVALEPEDYSHTIQEYSNVDSKNKKEIEKGVINEINSGKHKNIAWKEKRKQYEEHEDMKIYLISDNICRDIIKNNINNEKVLNYFSEILLYIPTSKNYSYIFEKYSEFLNAVNFIFNSKEFKNIQEQQENLIKEIFDTFNSIWDLLTIEFYFNEFENICSEDFNELLKTIKQVKVDISLFNLEDKLTNLLDYKKSLTLDKIKLDKDEERMMNILLEGANER
ncbi:MAG: hypothetical protein ACOC3Z_02320 [Nanoarchaeota archaeon]